MRWKHKGKKDDHRAVTVFAILPHKSDTHTYWLEKIVKRQVLKERALFWGLYWHTYKIQPVSLGNTEHARMEYIRRGREDEYKPPVNEFEEADV